MRGKTELIGAITAHIIYISSIITFLARMLLGTGPGYWIGIPILLMVIPLIYLLVKARVDKQPALYFIQVGLMLSWIVLLFLVDYLLKIDFRQTQWMVITFVTWYFAGMGGMIGVAAKAGRGWMISAIVLFFIAGTLAFVQRGVTGY